MKKIGVFLFLLVSVQLLNAQVKNVADSILEKSVVNKQFAGIAAGVLQNGKVSWEDGAGFSDMNQELPFTPSTKTRIASLVKPMTAIAIMQLYEKGKVDLDVPIQRYLPDYPQKEKGTITIRQLLQHTSGTPAYKGMKEINNKVQYDSIAAAVAIFKNRELVSFPGKEYHYSTYGYVLLGYIIEEVSGMSYGDYMQKFIWDKAGMSNTGIEDFTADYPGKSLLYRKNDKGKFYEEEKTNLSDRIPGGGVYSTLDDLLKFAKAILENKLIKESTFDLMLIPPKEIDETNNYGLGWNMYTEKQGFTYAFGHTGSQRGSSGQLIILPNRNACIVVISNTTDASLNIKRLSLKLNEVFFESYQN
jgi:CubicO group peptidase (beta-lactamase class C family)